MGQQKGNPIPSYQNQGYESLRPNTNARIGRDMGTKPVMIDDDRNLDELIDSSSWQFTKGYAKDSDLIDGTIDAKFNTLTANEYHVTILTSSVLYAGGSSKFGDTFDDRHNFTGSVNITGSTVQSGNNTLIGNTTLSGSIEVSGSSNFHNSLFIVTGSSFFTGSHNVKGNSTFTGSFNVTGNTVLSGSINVASGSSFYRAGNKLFNYGQWASLQIQSGSANTMYAMKLETQLDGRDGIYVANNSSGFPTRITVENTGLYNIQFSAQLTNTANTNITFDVWFAYTGSNIDNSNTQVDVNKSAGQLGRSVAAWNLLTPIEANDYVEIVWSCTSATGQLYYNGTQTTPTRPAIPSVIATITQVA